jgi:ABC-2 type transport system permease protein
VARHLVRLKLVLLRAGLATVGIQGRVAFGVAYLFAVVVGVVGGLAFLALRTASMADVRQFVPFGFGMLFVMWAFGPVLLLASDNTLEVDRLALFPLRPQQLMPGLLLGSMVGFGGLATVLSLLGAVGGTVRASLWATVVVVLAVALEFAICVAASRLVSTALSAATRKRRFRDVALTIVPLLVFAFQVAFNAATRGARLSVPRRLMESLPSGPPALAVVAARAGRPLAALVALAVSAAALLVIVWFWSVAIERVLTTAVESGGPARRDAGSSLFPRWARWLPANRAGAVAAKELRLQWRDPRRRSSVIASAFFALLPLVTVRGAGSGLGTGLVLLAVFPAALFGLAAVNLYGFDGPRFWMHLAAGDDARADLVGKDIETLIVGGVVTLAEALVLAAFTGGWRYVLPVLALAGLTLGVELGIGNVTSVMLPVTMPDSNTNVWASNSAQGIQTLVPVLLTMVATAAVVVPCVFWSKGLVDRPPAWVSAAVVQLALGALVWWVGLELAVRRSSGRQAELLAALSRQRGL